MRLKCHALPCAATVCVAMMGKGLNTDLIQIFLWGTKVLCPGADDNGEGFEQGN